MLEIMKVQFQDLERPGKILGAPSQQTKSNPNGPDTVCLSCLSHNLVKSNAKTSKCCFYRNIFNVNTCNVLNTSSLYINYFPCDLSIPYECLHFRQCSGFIAEKNSFIVVNDDECG